MCHATCSVFSMPGVRLAMLLWLLSGASTAEADPLTLRHNVSANLAWLQVGTWFPKRFWTIRPKTVQFWNNRSAGSYGVRMCKYDKVAVARKVATRASDQPNATAENCRDTDFEVLKSLVDDELSESCPVADISFIHHLPHAGSTALTSMLESITSVRTWSEYGFADSLSEHIEQVDQSDQRKVLKTLTQLLACSPTGEPKVQQMVIKLASRATAKRMDRIRDLFPDSPWLFLFRRPRQVLASACPEPTTGCHLGALGGRAVTEANVSVYLETLMRVGIQALIRSRDDGNRHLGKAVDYSTLITDLDVVLSHLRLSASSEERSAMAKVLHYDIKASKQHKSFVPFDQAEDVGRKDAIVAASPELIRVSSNLEPLYRDLRQLALPAVLTVDSSSPDSQRGFTAIQPLASQRVAW